MQSTGILGRGGGGDGWTDRRMKGKGGVKVEGVLEEREEIKMKVKWLTEWAASAFAD